MMQTTRRFAGLATTALVLSFAAQAAAQSREHPRFPFEARGSAYDPYTRGHNGGPGRRIYPPAYDWVRSYYGGRGDNRWRWSPGWTPYRGTDEGFEPWIGAPLPGAVGTRPWVW